VVTPYCLSYLDKGKTWLDFSDNIDEASETALKSAPDGAGIVNLTVTGTFMYGSAYGHTGSYRYKVVARKVWDVVTRVKGMKGRDKQEPLKQSGPAEMQILSSYLADFSELFFSTAKAWLARVTSAKKARSLAGSFFPGPDSTPLATSTA
jgi:hypothetical protein